MSEARGGIGSRPWRQGVLAVVERVTIEDLDPGPSPETAAEPKRLTVDALEPSGGGVEHQQQLTRVGFRLAGALLGVIIFVFLWVGVYARVAEMGSDMTVISMLRPTYT